MRVFSLVAPQSRFSSNRVMMSRCMDMSIPDICKDNSRQGGRFSTEYKTRRNRRDAGLTACLLRRSCSLCRASSRSRDTGERAKTGCVFRGDTGICSSTALGPSNVASVQKFASRIGCAFISALHWMGELEEMAKNKKNNILRIIGFKVCSISGKLISANVCL